MSAAPAPRKKSVSRPPIASGAKSPGTKKPAKEVRLRGFAAGASAARDRRTPPPSPGGGRTDDSGRPLGKARKDSSLLAKTRPPRAALPAPRTRGLSISVKLSAFFCLLIVASLVAMGLAFIVITREVVDRQINADGIKLVNLFTSSLDPDLLKEPESLSPTRLEQLQKRLEERRRMWEEQVKLLRSTLQRIEVKDVVDLIVVEDLNAQQWNLILGTQSISLSDTGPEDLRSAPAAGGEPAIEVRIQDGLHHAGGVRHRVRRFSAPVRDAQGRSVAWGVLFLYADVIDEVQQSLKERIYITTGLGIVIGGLLTFLVTALMTGHVRELMRDMGRVAEGDLQHRSQVKSRDEIGVLTETFNIMTANLETARQEMVHQQELELKSQAMAQELNIASEIQTQLLPERLPRCEGFDIRIHYASAKEVGGDYYDFVDVDADRIGFMVADVSGKGIPGSMVMTMTRSLLRMAAEHQESAAETLRRVNRILAPDMRRGMFVTAVYFILDVKRRNVRVASAGHNPLFIYRAQGGAIESVNPSGIALGFDKGPIFDHHIAEAVVELGAGDRLLAYTDGVVEAIGADGEEEFGAERVHEIMRQGASLNSNAFLQQLTAALTAHRGEQEQSDDITSLSIRVL